MSKFKNMKLRYKIGASIATGAAVVAGGGLAFAYFTSTGSGNGTGSVGNATNWSVTSVSTSGGTLYPGQGSNTVSAVVKNANTGNQGLNALTVTVNAPTNTNSSGNFGTEAACTAADFALNSANSSGWVISNSGDTATYSNTTAVDITAGHYVVSDADSSTNAGSALPTGLTLTMNDNTGAPQDQCQGATVNLTVAAS